MAQGDWFGANLVQNQIVVQALERLGYKVDLKSLDTTLAYQAIAQGDVAFWLDANWPETEAMYDAVKDHVVTVGKGTIIGGGLNGYLIDKATSEQHNLINIVQLKDPKLANLFAEDGSDKANLYECDVGWGCAALVNHQIRAFGLQKTVNPVQGKYQLLMAQVLARHERHKPILFYSWSPSWMVTALRPGKDVLWMEIPFDSAPKGVNPGSTKVPGVVGCADGHDPCHMATGPWNYIPEANRAFLRNNPAVARLLAEVGWPRQTWSAWEEDIHNGATTNTAILAIATRWIDHHSAEFTGWIKDAMQR